MTFLVSKVVDSHQEKFYSLIEVPIYVRRSGSPSHLYYEGVAYEVRSISDAVKAFIKLLERLELYIACAAGSTTFQVSEAGPLGTLHPDILAKCRKLYDDGTYPEAVEKSFKIVKDRLRKLTGYETGADAFGKGKLHIRGAAAPNVYFGTSMRE